MQYVFFGSGPVAVESFRTIRDFFQFEYVVTKSTTIHEIKRYVTSEKIIIVDNKLDVDEFVTTHISTESVGILIDFGVIISKLAIEKFSHGIINSHFSLLPALRGADPITHAILDGHTQTGVSLMLVDPGMDTGDIYAQSIVDLDNSLYVDELTDILVDISNAMIKECIPLIIDGDMAAVPQDVMSESPSYANKISKSDGIITESDTSEDVDKKVRAFSGWPGARTSFGDISVTLERGEIYTQHEAPHSGNILTKKINGQHLLLLGTRDGYYSITQLRPDGKKSMTAEAFLAGYKQKIDVETNQS